MSCVKVFHISMQTSSRSFPLRTESRVEAWQSLSRGRSFSLVWPLFLGFPWVCSRPSISPNLDEDLLQMGFAFSSGCSPEYQPLSLASLPGQSLSFPSTPFLDWLEVSLWALS